MRQKYRLLPDRAGSIPRPDDSSHQTVDAPDGHRVLIIGNDYAVSWGVRTHALGLPGQLVRELSQRTGRGADVDVISDPGMSITDVSTLVKGRDLVSYDSVVIITGVGDAYKLLPPLRWVVLLNALLSTVLSATTAGTAVTVVGIQPVSSVNVLDAKEGGVVDRWAEALNEMTQAVCHNKDRVSYLPAPDPESGDLDDTDRLRFKSPSVYKAWAVDVARHLVPLMSAAPAGTLVDSDAKADRRTVVLGDLGLLNPAIEARFTAIIRRARDLFTTEGSAFTVITDDVLWNKAVLGFTGSMVPAEESFCAVTISGSGAFVVEDSWHDDRIQFDTPVRFYAGYPVCAPDGTPIGALSVFDSQPRRDTSIDVGFLRELAEDITEHLLPPTPLTVAAAS
jgi:hypothetical protein